MTQRLSSAILTSALFHAAAIALIVALTYLAGLRTGKPVAFFELVAGAGDNYLATEAPALGTADGNPANVAAPEAPAPAMVVTAKAPTPAPAENRLWAVESAVCWVSSIADAFAEAAPWVETMSCAKPITVAL